MIDDKEANQKAIGNYLRHLREEFGLLQKDMAEKIGLGNANFLSMIEGGTTVIPLFRMESILRAYKVKPIMAIAILKALYPETWYLFVSLIDAIPQVLKEQLDTNNLDGIVNYEFAKELSGLKVDYPKKSRKKK